MDNHLEKLPWYLFSQPLDNVPAAIVSLVLMHYYRKGVHRLLVDQYVHFNQLGRPVIYGFVVNGGIAPGRRFQPVIEIKDYFVEGKLIFKDDPVFCQIAHIHLFAPLFFTKSHYRSDIVFGKIYFHLHIGLGYLAYSVAVWHLGWVVYVRNLVVCKIDVI